MTEREAKNLQVAFNPQSGNIKTGPIPVTTSPRSTCPNSCPLKSNGCYAEGYGLRFVWNDVDRANGAIIAGKSASDLVPKKLEKITSWEGLCDKVRALPPGQLWRHNQAGDLPNRDDEGNESIDERLLKSLADANQGRRGFTYTHKPLTPFNKAVLLAVNYWGLTINVSANTLAGADRAKALGLPAVVTVPMSYPKVGVSPAGNKVIVCPAQQTDKDTPGIEAREITCATCGLCQRREASRPIIAFRAHGQKAKMLSMRLEVMG